MKKFPEQPKKKRFCFIFKTQSELFNICCINNLPCSLKLHHTLSGNNFHSSGTNFIHFHSSLELPLVCCCSPNFRSQHRTGGMKYLASLFLLYSVCYYLFILAQNGSMTYNLHRRQLPPKGPKHIVG